MKLDEKNLLNCIGNVGDDLIHESETAMPVVTRRGYGSWLSAAAVLVLGVVVFGLYNLGPGALRLNEQDSAPNMILTDPAPIAGSAAPEAMPNDTNGINAPEMPQIIPPTEITPIPPLIMDPDETDPYNAESWADAPAWDDPNDGALEVIVIGPCSNCGAYDCPYRYVMNGARSAPTPPVRLLQDENLTPISRFHTFDMNQMPYAWGQGDIQLALVTDEPLFGTTIVALDSSTFLGQWFTHITDWSYHIGDWQPDVPLVMQNYTWRGHIPWFAITFRDANGASQYLTISENFVGGCMPQFQLHALDTHNLVPADGFAPVDVPLRLLERDPPPLVTELLGDFTSSEIRNFRNIAYPSLSVMYRQLYYDGRENFFIEHWVYEWGESPRLMFASVPARYLMHNNQVMMTTSQDFMTEYQFNTQTGDALFLWVPQLNATWLLIDIGQSPWHDEPMRSYAVIFRP